MPTTGGTATRPAWLHIEREHDVIHKDEEADDDPRRHKELLP